MQEVRMARSPGRRSVFDDPPRKQVLLLTCMDLRLLDDTVRFMNRLNLQNRYDHLVLAGSSMGARLVKSAGESGDALPWKSVFFDHLVTAIDTLHRDIKDIFLLEHLDCGAYKHLHPDADVKKAYTVCPHPADQIKFHRHEAREFAKEVRDFCEAKRRTAGEAWDGIRVRGFVMDLIGQVKEL